MWHRSASFILDKRHQNDTVTNPDSRPLSSASTVMAADNPDPQVSLYYQTRAAHYGVVTSDWLAQAQSAVGHPPDDGFSDNYVSGGEDDNKLGVVDEFNNWRKQPDLAEAVAAIRALSSVIRSSQATTMMELEIELKRASDSLKGISPILSLSPLFPQLPPLRRRHDDGRHHPTPPTTPPPSRPTTTVVSTDNRHLTTSLPPLHDRRCHHSATAVKPPPCICWFVRDKIEGCLQIRVIWRGKMGKTYVVFIGRNPGVYGNWPEAQLQVNGFSGSCHKAYDNKKEALQAFDAFLKNQAAVSSGSCATSSSSASVGASVSASAGASVGASVSASADASVSASASRQATSEENIAKLTDALSKVAEDLEEIKRQLQSLRIKDDE